MGVRQWLLAGALIAGGCATGGGVSDKDLARLPPAEHAEIVTAQKSVDVAASNMQAAKAARDEAKQFRRVAGTELDVAKSRLEAARNAVDLGAQKRDDRALRAAGRTEDEARLKLIAARAKLDYADRLVDLREARIAESEAAFAAARNDVELTKVRIAQRNGLGQDVDVNKIETRRQDAAERLAEERAHVADLEGETAQLRTAWDDRRDEMNRTASRNEEMLPETRGQPVPEEPAVTVPRPADPRGDVNDTPAAPEQPDAQAPRNNIAPPP